jgi:hypothetical protein
MNHQKVNPQFFNASKIEREESSTYTICLKTGEYVEDKFKITTKKITFLLIISRGTLDIDGSTFLHSGDLFLTNSLTQLSCKSDICYLTIIDKPNLKELNRNQLLPEIIKAPTGSYFDKYKASISSYNSEILREFFSPWTFYLAEIPSSKETELHIHKNLKNYIYFIESKVEKSSIVFKSGNKYYSKIITPGDIAIVNENVIHNIINFDSKNNLKFIVINDTTSDYETPDNSDYHIEENLPIEKLIPIPRVFDSPELIELSISEEKI